VKICGEKFCSNPEIKDTKECRDAILKNYPEWKGNCFFMRQGQGCEECGGKMVHAGGCQHCLSCGWSPCS